MTESNPGGRPGKTPAAVGETWLPFPVPAPGFRPPLTATQKQILEFIRGYRAQHGVSPTLQEIGDRFKTHRVTVHAHVTALVEKRFLVRFSKKASRSLIPVDELATAGAASIAEASRDAGLATGKERAAGEESRGPETERRAPPRPRREAARSTREARTAAGGTAAEPRLSLPLMGRIAAGRPLEAVYEHEAVDLGALFPTQRELFALEVVGDSMVDEQIRDGDYVVAERRSTARNGEIVVAVLPTEFGTAGEATLKRFFHEGDRIRLQPANGAMAPIYVDASAGLEIRGVVVGVIRRYR